jgi:hypothetical protein
MKTRILLALAGLAAGLITPAFSQDEVTPEIHQQIEALNQKFDEAINNHDPAACSACFVFKGVVVDPLGIFVGQQEIEKCYTKVFEVYPSISHQTNKLKLLYNFGGYTGGASDVCGLVSFANSESDGVRSIIYTTDDGTWKIRVMVQEFARASGK